MAVRVFLLAFLLVLAGSAAERIFAPELAVQAAEVSCVLFYGSELPTDAEARRLWPSGYKPTTGACRGGFIDGAIEAGDYAKVAQLFAANGKTLSSFRLKSPGGDADEAMKIGRLFRRYLISVSAPYPTETGILMLFGQQLVDPFEALVPRGKAAQLVNLCANNQECICASACALMWFGGIERIGQVGLHRPRTEDPRFRTMAPADASAAYRHVLGRISAYLNDMEAPRPVIDATVATSSSEIVWVDALRDRVQYPPSIAEWNDASCGSFTEQEFDKYAELASREATGLTANEQMLLSLLAKKSSNRSQCEIVLYHNHRDRLPPPAVPAPWADLKAQYSPSR